MWIKKFITRTESQLWHRAIFSISLPVTYKHKSETIEINKKKIKRVFFQLGACDGFKGLSCTFARCFGNLSLHLNQENCRLSTLQKRMNRYNGFLSLKLHDW
jgi:hypothetical protein